MKKKIITLLAGAVLSLNLGAGWPTELTTAVDPCTRTHRNCSRLYEDAWKHEGVLALYDSHLDELYGAWILPKGWVGSGSVWGHHQNMVRCFGLLSESGASAFVLLSPQEVLNMPLAELDEATLMEMNKAWEKLITVRYPGYKLCPEEGGQRLTWEEVPQEAMRELRRELPLNDMKQGRYIKLFTLRKDENNPEIHVALIADFSLSELNKNGRAITILLYRHVKLCFVPDYLDVTKTVAEVYTVARRAENVNAKWDAKRLSDDPTTCHAPESAGYGINHLVNDALSQESQGFTLCPNTFTGQRWRVPICTGSCWVNPSGNCLYLNTGNPNDIAPLNKVEWRRMR